MKSTPTKTEIAQLAVRSVVSMYVTKFAKDQIIDRTEMDPDGIPVKIVAGTVGQLAAVIAGSHTDKAVVTAIAKIKSWRENRKKTTESE